jgi:outer membrane cobalamin receptor
MMLNVQFKSNEFKVKFLADFYSIETKDGFGYFMSNDIDPIRLKFTSYLGEISNNFKLSNKVSLLTKYNLTYQLPWSAFDEDLQTFIDPNSPNYFSDAEYFYDKRPEKHSLTVSTNVDFNEKLNLIAGVVPSLLRSTGFNNRSYYYDVDGNEQESVCYSTWAIYAQSIYRSKFANITAGLRYEDHSQVGGAFVPRLGITRTFNNLHLKALFSQAFRTPSIENIELNKEIKPEKTTVFELEAGYVFTKNMLLTLNVFDIYISKPIVYSVTTDGEELYENLNKTGTLGFEVDYRIKTNWGYANIAYSYYNSNNKNEVGLYEVPNKSNILLGFPNHKVNLLSQIRMGKSFSLNPSLTFLSERYGVTNYDFNTDETTISGIEPTTLLNLNLLYENLLIDGLSVSVGVYDVLNSEYVYIQPYSGIHPQIPDGGREFTIKLSYRVK